MEKLFEALKQVLGEDVLTEDVKNDIKAQFEVAVEEKAKEKLEEKEKELEEENAKDAETFKDELVENIDSYMDYCTEKFMEENKVAIESEMKVEMAENIIKNMREIFSDYYFELPEEKVDVVQGLEEKVSKLTDEVNSLIEKNITKDKEITEAQKAIEFQKLTKDLTDVQKDEVMEMVEDLEINDVDDFKRKAKLVIEKVVNNKTTDKKTDVIDEDVEELEENENFDNKDNKNEEDTFEIDKYLPHR